MTSWLFTQFQTMTEPVVAEPETVTESRWHQPWSEPVRFKIAPKLAIALIAASGAFAPVFSPNVTPGSEYTTWYAPLNEPVKEPPRLHAALNPFEFYPQQKPLVSFAYYNFLSEPVREKRGLGAHLQQFDPLQAPVVPAVNRLIQWFAPLSEPVKLSPRLHAAANPYLFYQPEFPEDMDVDWFKWLTEPVRLPIGLKAYLQQTLAYPIRLLPTPDVTVTMDALETNGDVALIGIQVYDSTAPSSAGGAASVSIVEVAVQSNAAASIRED